MLESKDYLYSLQEVFISVHIFCLYTTTTQKVLETISAIIQTSCPLGLYVIALQKVCLKSSTNSLADLNQLVFNLVLIVFKSIECLFVKQSCTFTKFGNNNTQKYNSFIQIKNKTGYPVSRTDLSGYSKCGIRINWAGTRVVKKGIYKDDCSIEAIQLLYCSIGDKESLTEILFLLKQAL